MGTILHVRLTAPGFHRWPNPTHKRAYLAHSHRHLFYVEVSIPGRHNQREVEFHDLLDDARRLFPGGDMGGQSCETMATNLAMEIVQLYRRPATVTVWEDNECGATVSLPFGGEVMP